MMRSWETKPSDDVLAQLTESMLTLAKEYRLDPLWVIAGAAAEGLTPDECDVDVMRAVIAASKLFQGTDLFRKENALFSTALALDQGWCGSFIGAVRSEYYRRTRLPGTKGDRVVLRLR